MTNCPSMAALVRMDTPIKVTVSSDMFARTALATAGRCVGSSARRGRWMKVVRNAVVVVAMYMSAAAAVALCAG